MAPHRCQGLIISLGVAALILIGACDGKPIEFINIPAILTASWPSDFPPSHVGVRTSVHASWSNGPDEGLSIYNRSRVSLICLSILLAITHLPTLVIGAVWMMTTLHIGPSKLYPVIPGCVLESTTPRDFWKVVIPSVVRC